MSHGVSDVLAVPRDSEDELLNTSHTHQREWCLESLFCQGAGEHVQELTNRLRDFDGVNRVKIMVIRDN